MAASSPEVTGLCPKCVPDSGAAKARRPRFQVVSAPSNSARPLGTEREVRGAPRCGCACRTSSVRPRRAHGPYDAVVSVSGLAVDVNKLRGICDRYGVARLDVFGSTAGDQARSDSDIDVLYELAPGARLGWEIEDLADELSAPLGRRVDLVSRRGLHDRLRDQVLSEARLLYAA